MSRQPVESQSVRQEPGPLAVCLVGLTFAFAAAAFAAVSYLGVLGWWSLLAESVVGFLLPEEDEGRWPEEAGLGGGPPLAGGRCWAVAGAGGVCQSRPDHTRARERESKAGGDLGS